MVRSRFVALVLLGFAGACSSVEPAIPSTTFPEPTSTASAATTDVSVATTTTMAVAVGGRAVDVPRAELAPAVDGSIDPDEWAAAAIEVMDDGTAIHFLEADSYVYVAVAASEIRAVNLLVTDGDVVHILHSSAALGSAHYERDGDEWVLTHDFDWCCRSGADESERIDLLAQEGWQANIGHAATAGHVEYQVRIEDGSRVALSSVRRDGSAAVWPTNLDEEARRPLYGRRNDVESFDLEGWTILRFRFDD